MAKGDNKQGNSRANMNSYKKLNFLLSRKQKIKILLLLVPVSIGSLANIFGIALIMPLLALMSDPSLATSNPKFKFVYELCGFHDVFTYVVATGVASFIMVVVNSFFSIYTIWKSSEVVQEVKSSLTKVMYERYLKKPYSYFLMRNSSSLISNLFVLIPNVSEKYVLPGIEIISGLISSLTVASFIVFVNPVIASIISFGFGGSYFLIFKYLKKRMVENGKRIVQINDSMVKQANETFGGIKDIKIRQNEGHFIASLSAKLQEKAKKSSYNYAMSHTPKYILDLLAFGGIVLAIVIVYSMGHQVQKMIPLLAMYVYAGYRVMPSLQKIFYGMSSVKSASADVDQIYSSIHDCDLEEMDNSKSKKDITIPFKHSFLMKKLSFSYPNSEKKVLDSIDFRVDKNEVVGVIGKTGAGKTTLIDVLLGLLNPVSGKIVVDNTTIVNKAQQSAWKKKVGYVPQNIYLCDASIKENIAFGELKDKINDLKVKECAKMASISSFIETELPDRYETKVGERGVRLSGGQVQRIGIARALYRDPSFIVLDEATSALDGVTESDVMSSIYKMKRKVTMVVIAHRLSTLQSCDRVYELKEGRLLETDSCFKDS